MRLLVLLAMVLVAACASLSGPETTITALPPTTTTPAATTVSGRATTQPGGSCSTDSVFIDQGPVLQAEQPTSDTNSLGLISWTVDDGCERFDIDLETTEGAPATTPPSVVVEFLETRQILRVWTDVDATVVTDQLVETPLVDRLFVVKALDGGIFVDFHLAGPSQASVGIASSPAQLTLELQPALDAFSTPAVLAENVVVLTPGEGIQTGTAVNVSGYSRTFEAAVLVVATAGDVVVAEANLVAADWTETWGEFHTSLSLPPGDISLFVGEESADDGELVGATIAIAVR